MGYYTQLWIVPIADDGFTTDECGRKLAEKFPSLDATREGLVCGNGKWYDDSLDRLVEATAGIPATFEITGVGEQPYVPGRWNNLQAGSAPLPGQSVDIWRMFARNGKRGAKHAAAVELPAAPDVEAEPVPTIGQLTVSELVDMAGDGNRDALEEIFERARRYEDLRN